MDNYGHPVALAIIVVTLLAFMLVVLPWTIPLPSENTCQKYNDNPLTFHTPAEYWCEHNETGWHFNQTAYNQSWQNGVFT